MRKLLVGAVIAISFSACTIEGGPGAEVGGAEARIASVPSNVACVSIAVAGPTRSVVDNFDVAAGQSATLKLANLPVGNDLFSAVAYPVACASSGGAQADWQTPSAVLATVSAGSVTSLSLDLEPTGGASVGLNFGDGGCSGDGGCVHSDGGPTNYDGGPINYDGGLNDLAPGAYDGGGADLAPGPYDGGGPFVDMAYRHD